MSQKKLFNLIGPTLFLSLFFFIFWYLIYFEKNSALVFGGFVLLAFLFLCSFAYFWKGFKEFGIRFDNLIPAFRPAALLFAVLTASGLLFEILFFHHTKLPKGNDLITFFIWGFLQQCLVQGYFFRAFESALESRRLTIFCTALMFSLLHIPNLHLMAVTFLGGLYLSWFYSKYRNLIVAGLLHGIISLLLVMTLKPAGWLANYRTGPEPMSPIRHMIHQNAAPRTEVGHFVPSDVPSILEHDFGPLCRPLETGEDLARFLAEPEQVFVVLGRGDYERFRLEHSGTTVYVWKRSLIWRRKFPQMKQKIINAIVTADLRQLHNLFRAPFVLISNRPAGT